MILLKPPQAQVFQSTARFRVLVAGRRFGKTFLAMTELCRGAGQPGRVVGLVAPAKNKATRPLGLVRRTDL